jgi:hypothetical protein
MPESQQSGFPAAATLNHPILRRHRIQVRRLVSSPATGNALHREPTAVWAEIHRCSALMLSNAFATSRPSCFSTHRALWYSPSIVHAAVALPRTVVADIKTTRLDDIPCSKPPDKSGTFISGTVTTTSFARRGPHLQQMPPQSRIGNIAALVWIRDNPRFSDRSQPQVEQSGCQSRR